MELKDVVAISGTPGLYKIVGRSRSGLIVESFEDQPRRFSTTLSQKISVLDDIAMFTKEGETKLRQIFIQLMENDSIVAPDAKAADADFKSFMDKALPDYDKEKVYVSDIKKLAKWYTTLKPFLDLEILKKPADSEEVTEEGAEGKKEVKKTESKAKINKDSKPLKTNTKSLGKKSTSAPRKMGS